jgi:hypothetical protein
MKEAIAIVKGDYTGLPHFYYHGTAKREPRRAFTGADY